MGPLTKPLVIIGFTIAIATAIFVYIGIDGSIITDWISNFVGHVITGILSIFVDVIKGIVNAILSALGINTSGLWDWLGGQWSQFWDIVTWPW